MVMFTIGLALSTASHDQGGTYHEKESSSGGHCRVFNTDNAQLNLGAYQVQSSTEKSMNREISIARPVT